MQSRELHVHFAFWSTLQVARGILLYTWIIITVFECDNAFDFMYKFSKEYSAYLRFYPNFKSGRLELLDSYLWIWSL